jgi:hypothetical protein
MNRENILATIADLKAELSTIDVTKKQIESSLQVLTELMKSPLMSGGKRSVSTRTVEKKSVRTKLPSEVAQGIEGGLVASDRVHVILRNMHGRFSRSELYKNANNDGNGFIAPGTFANIFSKLIKRKQIVCVEGAPGQRDSVYKKAEEVGLDEEAPALTGFDLT